VRAGSRAARGREREIGHVKPFNVRRDFVEPEDGVATIDWVVLLAALVGLGYAIVDRTAAPLGEHSRGIRGEIQNNEFETTWLDNLPVGPSGAGVPGVIQTSNQGGGSGSGDDGNGDTGGDPGSGTDEPDPAPDVPLEGGSSGGGGGEGPVVPASNVQGCPDPGAYIAEPIVTTGPVLRYNQIKASGATIGGATKNLVNCPEIDEIGQFYANPTYTLDLSEMENYWGLTIEVRSQCDSSILLKDATGEWHFDDNSGSAGPNDEGNSLDGRIWFYDMPALEGRVNIWIGTQDGAVCSGAEVTISLR
jgi:hypothetical protein